VSAPLAGYPVDAPPLGGPAVLDQRWVDVAFLHWPVDPDSVRRFFPPGSRPDVLDGLTYVGLVPFAMRGAGVGRLGAVPYFGSFLETNVRLYSVDDAGHHGVLFRTLDTSRLAIVPFARTIFGVPYVWAQMRYRRSGGLAEYRAVRRWPKRGLSSRVVLEIGEPVQPTPLEIWLTARWGLHSRLLGRSWWTPNEHGRWPLFSARLDAIEDDFVAAAGITAAGAMLRPLFSPGVRTRFGLPRPL
jgi:uncharacterized protein YqjF (DUF2071 family)